MLEYILIGSFFSIFFSYFGYPISLIILRSFRKKNVSKGEIFPDVTLIITAYNEEKRIRNKIENTLGIVYPREKLQVIIASDGSTDKTNRIAKEYEHSGIELLSVPVRQGKENTQKDALKIARGSVIVFTDVATMIEPCGLERMVSNFADPTIGCVSSEDRLVGRDGKPSGEGFYVRYEMMIRRLESEVHSLVGLSGSFFAARKSVCQDFSGEMQSDFRILLNAVRYGFRGVTDPDVTGSYLDVLHGGQEFERKVRTVLRGLTVYFHHAEFLNIFRYGFFSYQYFCHKLLRWLVPLFLLAAFLSNGYLATVSGGYLILFLGQSFFYCIALWGWRNQQLTGNIIRIPYYFLTVNTSILVAWWRYLRHQRVVMWTPSER